MKVYSLQASLYFSFLKKGTFTLYVLVPFCVETIREGG